MYPVSGEKTKTTESQNQKANRKPKAATVRNTMKLLYSALHAILLLTWSLSGEYAEAFHVRSTRQHEIVSHLRSSTVSEPVITSPKERKIIPVTLLSGFLGSGKTSLLKNLLENKEKAKIGVIVNDVASVNIDAKLISQQADDMMELQNGCACCSLSDELVVAVEKLVHGRDLDAIVVELSGVADPGAIRFTWKPHGLQERMNVKLTNVVTLVDAMTFGSDYLTWDVAGEREEWVEPEDTCSRSAMVSELLVEQVETANVVLINKVDVASAEQVQVATSIVEALNRKARVLSTEFGRVSTDLVLGDSTTKKEKKPCCSNSNCSSKKNSSSECNETNSERKSSECGSTRQQSATRRDITTDDLAISSFVYTATKPFMLQRIMNLVNQWPIPIKDTVDLTALKDPLSNSYFEGSAVTATSPFVGVLRSKGFCWFAPDSWSGMNEDSFRHDTAMYWSHAGRQFEISVAGKWWASNSDANMRKRFRHNQAEYSRIKKEEFKTEEFGDRRQEIVFIGTQLKEDEIRSALDMCLCTDEEMVTYRQGVKNRLQSIYDEISLR